MATITQGENLAILKSSETCDKEEDILRHQEEKSTKGPMSHQSAGGGGAATGPAGACPLPRGAERTGYTPPCTSPDEISRLGLQWGPHKLSPAVSWDFKEEAY